MTLEYAIWDMLQKHQQLCFYHQLGGVESRKGVHSNWGYPRLQVYPQLTGNFSYEYPRFTRFTNAKGTDKSNEFQTQFVIKTYKKVHLLNKIPPQDNS